MKKDAEQKKKERSESVKDNSRVALDKHKYANLHPTLQLIGEADSRFPDGSKPNLSRRNVCRKILIVTHLDSHHQRRN